MLLAGGESAGQGPPRSRSHWATRQRVFPPTRTKRDEHGPRCRQDLGRGLRESPVSHLFSSRLCISLACAFASVCESGKAEPRGRWVLRSPSAVMGQRAKVRDKSKRQTQHATLRLERAQTARNKGQKVIQQPWDPVVHTRPAWALGPILDAAEEDASHPRHVLFPPASA